MLPHERHGGKKRVPIVPTKDHKPNLISRTSPPRNKRGILPQSIDKMSLALFLGGETV